MGMAKVGRMPTDRASMQRHADELEAEAAAIEQKLGVPDPGQSIGPEIEQHPLHPLEQLHNHLLAATKADRDFHYKPTVRFGTFCTGRCYSSNRKTLAPPSARARHGDR
jgi:hypothetical protein